uniref:Uncharacterized protein n=1 Tax=Anguilla anguilla TaxID=7936 RepID=A0A0E9WUI8_ANGAN
MFSRLKLSNLSSCSRSVKVYLICWQTATAETIRLLVSVKEWIADSKCFMTPILGQHL